MFSQYIALGDSLSIDMYPALDAGETDVAVALERVPTAGAMAPIGAASLFYRNDDARWTEEAGTDLVTQFHAIEHVNHAAEGATIGDVFGAQLPSVDRSDVPTLFTLTIGSEDIFSAYRNEPSMRLLKRIARDVSQAYDALLDRIMEIRPEATVLVTTMCDPSDRTGRVPGVLGGARLPLLPIDTVNQHIRARTAEAEHLVLADAYVHFLGHGSSVPQEDRWYWRRSPLEPNAMGANELRKVWLGALR
ncbi:MAG: hypothetical protein H0X64_04915 [Gemmatimonadaceae bacterium]|nr:hypothetical protein [Gemmatimonadaceae bacterium]